MLGKNDSCYRSISPTPHDATYDHCSARPGSSGTRRCLSKFSADADPRVGRVRRKSRPMEEIRGAPPGPIAAAGPPATSPPPAAPETDAGLAAVPEAAAEEAAGADEPAADAAPGTYSLRNRGERADARA